MSRKKRDWFSLHACFRRSHPWSRTPPKGVSQKCRDCRVYAKHPARIPIPPADPSGTRMLKRAKAHKHAYLTPSLSITNGLTAQQTVTPITSQTRWKQETFTQVSEVFDQASPRRAQSNVEFRYVWWENVSMWYGQFFGVQPYHLQLCSVKKWLINKARCYYALMFISSAVRMDSLTLKLSSAKVQPLSYHRKIALWISLFF